MAKESFDKQLQLLRTLSLMNGALTREQLAERLGISVHTYDKTMQRLKQISRTMQHDKWSPLTLFRAKSLKKSESVRLVFWLGQLRQQTWTVTQLIDQWVQHVEPLTVTPDEKTVRADLTYLEQVGLIRKASTTRPYFYTVVDDFATQLTLAEWVDLYYFVDIMAHTRIPSVQGFLLRDRLQKWLSRQPVRVPFQRIRFKYHYPTRLLDEAHLYPLLQAIERHRMVAFQYFTPRTHQHYVAQPTNPLFARKKAGKRITVTPLKVIYDHQYGRWYLLGYGNKKIQKFRLEGITQLEEQSAVLESTFDERKASVENKLQHSWVIDTGPLVTVKIRFFNPGENKRNFVRERVCLQGQWGAIVEEEAHSFIYEIQVTSIYEITPWIRSFGSSCEVLEPIQLREKMIADWKELKTIYESF